MSGLSAVTHLTVRHHLPDPESTEMNHFGPPQPGRQGRMKHENFKVGVNLATKETLLLFSRSVEIQI